MLRVSDRVVRRKQAKSILRCPISTKRSAPEERAQRARLSQGSTKIGPPPMIGDFHLRNLEALAPTDRCSNPFSEVSAFRHRPQDYGAYGGALGNDGKSIGVLAPDTLPVLATSTETRDADTARLLSAKVV